MNLVIRIEDRRVPQRSGSGRVHKGGKAEKNRKPHSDVFLPVYESEMLSLPVPTVSSVS